LRLGLPDVRWTLPLLGLCVFTFAIVSFYAPVGEFGILIAVVGLLIGGLRLRIPSPVWLYGAFILWSLFAAFGAPNTSTAITEVIEQFKLFLIMIIVVNALRAPGQLKFYLLFFLACYVLFPIRGALINFYVSGYGTFGRAIWNYIYSNPNDLAALTLIAFSMSLGVGFTSEPRTLVRWGAVVAGLLTLGVIFLTQSRGAFLGFVIALGIPLSRLGLKHPKAFIPAAIAVAIVGVSVLPESVWDRIGGIRALTSTTSAVEADEEGSAAERLAIQGIALRIVSDYPIFGVGIGAYGIAHNQYDPALGFKDTHNTYLKLAAEVGIPGLILWCVLVMSVLKNARSARQRLPSSELSRQQIWLERGLIAYLIAGIFGSYSSLTFPYVVMALLWTSANLIREEIKLSVSANTPAPLRSKT
jgi:O-antigen ligase